MKSISMGSLIREQTKYITDMIVNTYMNYQAGPLQLQNYTQHNASPSEHTMEPGQVPTCVDDFERHAQMTLDRNARGYFASGADEEQTLAENRKAFKRYYIRPRYMRDMTSAVTSASVLGHPISFPLCIAPTGYQAMAHPDAETAVARAGASMGIATTLSYMSNTTLEDVAQGSPGSHMFLQLYIFKDRSHSEAMIRRAEAAGYRGFILTVDVPCIGKRRIDIKNKFKLPDHLRVAHYDTSEVRGKKHGSLNEFISSQLDRSLNWKDLAWLKSITKLPVIVKGIMTGEDAVLAVEHNADGILVSNHGGRQLDGVPATIDALPEVVRKVAGRCPVYLDGGVRTGTDILKAVALGADAVFIGRPAIYGLAYDGEAGVHKMLEILKDEFTRAMLLSGCRNLEEVKTQGLIVHESYYRNAKL